MANELPVFESSSPIVTPPVAQKTYDKFWLQKFIVEAPNPTIPAAFTAVFIPYDGALELSPGGQPVYVSVNDLFSVAIQNSDVGIALNATLLALKKLGQAQGVFTADPVVENGTTETVSS